MRTMSAPLLDYHRKIRKESIVLVEVPDFKSLGEAGGVQVSRAWVTANLEAKGSIYLG